MQFNLNKWREMDNDSLSQDEINALLNAMSSEQKSSLPENDEAPKPLLSQDEVNTLLNAVSSSQGSPIPNIAGSLSATKITSSKHKNVNAEKYDFTMPSRVSKDHVRALRALHISYARNLSSALSMALRAVIEVECT